MMLKSLIILVNKWKETKDKEIVYINKLHL